MPVIGRFFSVLPVFLGAQACQANCNNEIIYRAVSPSGNYAASLFQRNCGATSGNNLQVSIFRSDAPQDGAGNTFVVDYPDQYYYRDHSRPKMQVYWTSDSSVIIEYSRSARIFTQAVMIQGVSVGYIIK